MADTTKFILSGTLETNEASDTTTYWKGGKGALACRGTWGGGNVAVQFSLDGSNWVDVRSGLSADGTHTIEVPIGVELRVKATSVTSVVYHFAPVEGK